MVVYLLVTATAPATEMSTSVKVSFATRMEYPPYIKKLYDFMSQYTNYTLYKCDDAKLTDAYRFLGNRYHKIAAQVQGYDYIIEILLETTEVQKLTGVTE